MLYFYQISLSTPRQACFNVNCNCREGHYNTIMKIFQWDNCCSLRARWLCEVKTQMKFKFWFCKQDGQKLTTFTSKWRISVPTFLSNLLLDPKLQHRVWIAALNASLSKLNFYDGVMESWTGTSGCTSSTNSAKQQHKKPTWTIGGGSRKSWQVCISDGQTVALLVTLGAVPDICVSYRIFLTTFSQVFKFKLILISCLK